MINSNLGRISHRFQDMASFPLPQCIMMLQSHPRSSIYVIWKPVCDFLLVINSNLGPILHRLATLHPWRTDRHTDGRQPWQYSSTVT